MSIKAKLTTLIVAFVLLATMLIVGVLSVKKADFDVGGSITFDVKGIKAKIELVSLEKGSLKDEPDQEGKLGTIEIDNDMTEDEVADAFALWRGLKLQFDTEEPEDVVMQVKITNLAGQDEMEENLIDISASASFKETENCRISVANNAGGAAAMLSPGDDATFTITFSVKNPDYNATMDGFVVDFNMQRKALADIPVGAEGLEFSYVDEDAKDALQVAWDGETEIVDVEIPPFVNYDGKILPVQTIGFWGFEDCQTLESVVLPNSMPNISEGAFWGCASLTNVTIPNSVTVIEPEAFSQCRSLESVVIPNSVTTIEEEAFVSTGLININIPEGVTRITGTRVFSYCESLESIVVEEGNRVYNSKNNCNAIIETATNTLIVGCQNTVIPNGVTSICSRAFLGCAELVNISLPSSVTSIGDSAFWGCTNLTSISIPERVTSIGQDAFGNCTSLESITIPDSVTSIGSNAFNGCTSLTNITIPDSVTSIGSNAFNGCTSLTNITIPDSVTSIGAYAFRGCTALETAVIESKTIASQLDGDGGNQCGALLLNAIEVKVPKTLEESLHSFVKENYLDVASETINNREYNVYTLNFITFSLSGNMYESLQISWNGVTKSGPLIIPSYAMFEGAYLPVDCVGVEGFKDCTNITKIIFPETMDAIWDSAFSGCTSLESITLPSSVISIGGSAFLGCTSLKSVIIGNSVTSIGQFAFSGCSALESIAIPEGVTSIGQHAFSGCTSLNDVYYTGTEEEWDAIDIHRYGNDLLKNATIHYEYDPNEE